MDVYRRLGKRALDLAIAVPAAAATAPLVITAAAVVKVRMGGSPFFLQERPGLHGHPFRLIKLRTMHDAVDKAGQPLSDAERLTTLGRALRASSIDELPQLWNVIVGDMSLVGPRPLLMRYLGRYTAEQARRHEVKPGITGLAQVSGRNALSWDEKFALDVWYVDHVSVFLDLELLGRTVWKVVGRSGISQAGHATMPEFLGTTTTATTSRSTTGPAQTESA